MKGDDWMLAGHAPAQRWRGGVEIKGRTCWTMMKNGRTATAIVAAHPMGRELWVLVDGEPWASQVHPSDEKANADAGERYRRGVATGWIDSPVK